jgi:hypothetical protein
MNAQEKAEMARDVAEAAADSYVTARGIDLTGNIVREVFIDGFMTAIESLLTLQEIKEKERS